jgi:nucleotide-binding universal stress UspA family protein
MKGQAAKSAHLLLLVDESSASKRMVAYVAGIIGRRRNFHIHLLYLMPFMPVQLLETGGADTPKKETELNTELHRQQGQWIVSTETAAKPALDELVRVLREAGIPNRAIDIEFTDPYESGSPDRAIVVFAGEMQCHTIVIGHDSHSWFREMTGGHLTEHLLRHAKGIAIWVVQ